MDNSTLWRSNVEAEPRSFVEIGTRGVQSAAQAMDKNGNLFFGTMTPNAIACWNSRTPYSRANFRIVANNEEKLQFASGIKIVTNKKGEEELFVLTCRFQKLMTGTMNVNEPNFRIQALKVNQLIDGDRCGTGFSNVAFPTF